MKVPTVHLNGTSKAELLDQLATASGGVQRAMEALREASPNGRDYYVQGSSATQEAMAEHVDRHNRLKSVWDELVAIYEAIEAQGR